MEGNDEKDVCFSGFLGWFFVRFCPAWKSSRPNKGWPLGWSIDQGFPTKFFIDPQRCCGRSSSTRFHGFPLFKGIFHPSIVSLDRRQATLGLSMAYPLHFETVDVLPYFCFTECLFLCLSHPLANTWPVAFSHNQRMEVSPMFPPTWDFSAAYSINPLANKTLKRQLEDEDCNQAAVDGGSSRYFCFWRWTYRVVKFPWLLMISVLIRWGALDSRSHQKPYKFPLPILVGTKALLGICSPLQSSGFFSLIHQGEDRTELVCSEGWNSISFECLEE